MVIARTETVLLDALVTLLCQLFAGSHFTRGRGFCRSNVIGKFSQNQREGDEKNFHLTDDGNR